MGKVVVLGDQIGHKHFRGMVVEESALGDADYVTHLHNLGVVRKALPEEERHESVDPMKATAAGTSAEAELARRDASIQGLHQQVADWKKRAEEAASLARDRFDQAERLRLDLAEQKAKADDLARRVEELESTPQTEQRKPRKG